jgi:hypothetical protein
VVKAVAAGLARAARVSAVVAGTLAGVAAAKVAEAAPRVAAVAGWTAGGGESARSGPSGTPRSNTRAGNR